jgi:hypothetical protein
MTSTDTDQFTRFGVYSARAASRWTPQAQTIDRYAARIMPLRGEPKYSPLGQSRRVANGTRKVNDAEFAIEVIVFR